MIINQSNNPKARAKALDQLARNHDTLIGWVRRMRFDLHMTPEQIIEMGVRRGFIDEEMEAAVISLRVEDFKARL